MYFPRIHRRNRLMRKRQLLKWVLTGFWHSLVVFFGWYFLWDSFCSFESDPGGDGAVSDLEGFGTVVAFNSVLVINLKILLEARHWNGLLLGTVLLSVLSYPAVTILTQQWLMVNFFSNAYQFR